MFTTEESQLIADSLQSGARNQGLNQPEEQRQMMKCIIAKLNKAERQRAEADVRSTPGPDFDATGTNGRTRPAIKDHDGENPIGMA